MQVSIVLDVKGGGGLCWEQLKPIVLLSIVALRALEGQLLNCLNGVARDYLVPTQDKLLLPPFGCGPLG